jgi:hypothetical protein
VFLSPSIRPRRPPAADGFFLRGPSAASFSRMMADDPTRLAEEAEADALALATAMIACRLVDGPATSPDSRVIQLANALSTDIASKMEPHFLSADAQEMLALGLARFAHLAGSLAGIAVEIIQAGQRSGFNISNLDQFLASPYVMPDVGP